MKKKLNRIIEIPCEEESKEEIAEWYRLYLADNDDYINGNILVESGRFKAVDIVIYEGCSNIEKLIRILTT